MIGKQINACALTVALTSQPLLFAQSTPSRLPDGTKVPLRLAETISSATAKEGDIITFEVVEDVTLGNRVVVKQGTTARGVVIESQAKRRMGRAGKLSYTLTDTKSIDGRKIKLRATKQGVGDSHTTGVAVTTVAVAVFVPVAAPFFLLRKGQDLVVPQGTHVDAYVDGDQDVLQAVEASQPVQPVTAATQTLTDQDVIDLHHAGFTDDLIITKIRSARTSFTLSTQNLLELKNMGLSEKVIEAMMEASKQR